MTQAASPDVKEVPEGCQEIPGFILDVFGGSAWVTQDGRITDRWSERGVWPTKEAAEEMMASLFDETTPSTTP